MPLEFPKEPIERPCSITIDPSTGDILVANPSLWSVDGDTVTVQVYIRRDEEIVLPSIFERPDGTQYLVFKHAKEHDYLMVDGQARREAHHNGWEWVLTERL